MGGRSWHRSVGVIVAVVVCAVLPPAATAGSRTGEVTYSGSGSTAAYPILQPLFEYYTKSVDRHTRFTYNPNGGNKGVADVRNGVSNFALNARPPLLSDAPTVHVKGFMDGLCIAVNQANSLTSITNTEVKDIFLGVSRDWASLPASKLRGTIVPFGRDSAGGTYQFLRDGVLGGSAQAGVVTTSQTDGEVKQGVANNSNGISYAGLGWIGGKVKALGYDSGTGSAVPCDKANVKTFRYPLSRYFWFVLPTKNGDGATPVAEPRLRGFINWVRSDSKAASLIEESGGVALTGAVQG